MALSAPSVNLSVTPSSSKSFWYCLTSAFFGWLRMFTSAASSSSSSAVTMGRRPMNSGIIPNLSRSSGSTCLSSSVRLRCFLRLDVRAEAEAAAAQPPLDDLLQAAERAAADEEDVGGVDLQELLLRVLAAALGRDVGDGALDDLQQRLLHALAATRRG